MTDTPSMTADPRSSIDETPRSSPDEMSSSMSRSSSKDSSIDTKPLKPRRPTNYAERKSSIRDTHSKNLSLSSTTGVTLPLPEKIPLMPTFTPILERHSESYIQGEGDGMEEQGGGMEGQWFDLVMPIRAETEVLKVPATQMYWHRPCTHGMIRTGPMRRSHSISQVGSTFYIIGGSDGKPPKATNTVFTFDAGIPILSYLP
jgi:hypothetical protein